MSKLCFGYCDIITTPPASMVQGGYQNRSCHGMGNSGVMDELFARALSLKYEKEELMIVTLDLCLINIETADIIREKISKKINIPKDNIMLCVSHTHSGPEVVKTLLYDTVTDTDTEAEKRIDAYLEDLTDKIVTICSQAQTGNFKAKLYSATYSANLGYNRRYLMEDENGSPTVKMLFNLWRNPGHDINGIVDPDIPVLMIERIDEKCYDSYLSQNGVDRIVLFNVPIHPVVMGSANRYISADYPGAARRCIEESLGDGTKAMFMPGACGNINPMLSCQGNPKAVQIFGSAVGCGVITALAGRKKVELDGLKAIVENISLNENATCGRITTQVFKIGKAAVAAVSNECFTELGIEIRKRSGFEQTLVATNSNGGYGYVPTRESWGISGGYEVPIAKKVGFDEGLLEMMTETIVKNLKELNR